MFDISTGMNYKKKLDDSFVNLGFAWKINGKK
jgi:hypothetical protein